ncbi:MAG: Sua5/YciO/YrdC/YwlC family protein [Planctomycetes bacterium]|nr:Sua5/YciO/YrdC/YwlC family protein [Planctomycetota bacterium]
MAEVLPWQNSPDARATLARIVGALDEGGLVAFPTETTYVLAASARAPAAVERLLSYRCPSPEPPLALAVLGPIQAFDLLPGLTPIARRLARRCWPGPVTLACGGGLAGAALVPDAVKEKVVVGGVLPLRSPAHSAILHALHDLGAPFVVTPSAAVTASELPESVGQDAVLIVDGGRCRFGHRPTVVRIDGDRWELLHEGLITREQLQLQAACVIVFVCTGNTCRSPLAEVLCKRRLAERLGCAVEELPQRGFVVVSAGVAAYHGDQAAAPAIEVARGYGADLGGHLSQPLDHRLATQADHLIGMTQGHLESLRSLFPHLDCEPRLLSPSGVDLPDPIGQDESVYRTCAEQIWQDLEVFVRDLTA